MFPFRVEWNGNPIHWNDPHTKKILFFFNSSTFQGRLRNSISQNPCLCQVMATYPKQSGIPQVFFLAIDWPKKTIHCPICLRWWIPGKHVIPKASEPHYPSLSVWSECGSSRPISVPALGIRQSTGKKWWHWKLWFIVRENKYDKKSHCRGVSNCKSCSSDETNNRNRLWIHRLC